MTEKGKKIVCAMYDVATMTPFFLVYVRARERKLENVSEREFARVVCVNKTEIQKGNSTRRSNSVSFVFCVRAMKRKRDEERERKRLCV